MTTDAQILFQRDVESAIVGARHQISFFRHRKDELMDLLDFSMHTELSDLSILHLRKTYNL